MLKKCSRNNRLRDISPHSDINRCNVISMPSVATTDTPKRTPFWSIRLLISSTTRADMACPSWIDRDHLDPSELRLVFDKVPELVEPPRMQTATLRPTNRYPSSDSLEVFKGDPSLGAFGLSHYLLGDHMVHIPFEPRLFSRETLEMTLRTLGPTALKVCFESGVSLSDLIHLFSRVVFPIAVIGEIHQAQVYAQCSNRIIGGFFGGVDSSSKIENAISEKKICLSLESVHSSLLVVSYPDGDLDTSLEGEYGGVFESLPAEDPLIVNHCTVSPELAEYVLVSFVGFDDLADGSNGHLGAEPVLLPDPVVDELVESPVIGESVLVGYFGYVVAGLVEPFHSLKQKVVLFIVWGKFYQERKLHLHGLNYSIVNMGFPPIPPTAKAVGILGGFW